MKFDCEIEVLSPVHIGSGAPLTPMDYVVSNGNFAKFALDRYLSSKPERFATAFLMKLEAQIREKKGRVSLMNLLEKAEENNKSFWEWSILIEPSAEDLIRHLVNGKEKGRLLDFHTFIRDSNGTLMIPGSSVKGALRTSFAYWLLKQKDFQSVLQGIRTLTPDKGKKRVSRDLDKIEDIIFRDINSPDAKNDILRFLQVSDFYPSSSNPTYAIYSRIMSAQPGKNQYSFTKNGNPRYSFFEAVLPPKSVFKGSIKMELDMLKAIKIYSWNWSAKNCLNQIVRAANDLSLKQIAFDSYFLNKYVSPVAGEKDSGFIGENYYKINEIRKQMSVNECILRIGAGGGWYSKTIGLHLYNHDSKTGNFEQMDMLQELKKRIKGSKIPQEFPKTRRIVFNKTDDIPAFPMGWIKLKLTKVSEDPCSTA
ncbi:MAG TPA: type III-A CRISPR-associated RAMP protein Csm5 [Geobacterales bacterium]|nr:type III-A CRISPR-associated RAMP protein Csm5 [Geobacterales bacterium]